jgi:tripartite-type tricarboxylate transporter receptor subunit TctC
MKQKHMKKAQLAALVLLTALPAFAVAQNYPSRAVRIVVPYPAGGPTDILARAVAPHLTTALGQTFVVDNRAGAGGIIGTEAVAKSQPDGYTLAWGTPGTHAINPAIYPKLPYDPMKDFAFITLVAQGTNVLVIHPSVPAKNVKELVALAKIRDGKLNFSSAGNGATSHLAGEMFRTLSGIRMTHIPFKGAAPAIVALVGGEVDLAILDMPALLPHIQSGKLRALGVASAKRSSVLPDLPTLQEAGVKDFDASSWHGLYAPAGTPKEIVARLNTEMARIVKLPEVQSRMSALGAEPVGNTPEQFEAFSRSEVARWGRVVKASGARVE